MRGARKYKKRCQRADVACAGPVPRRGGRFQAVSPDPGALLDARARRVTLVLEAFYAERDRARTGDDPRSAPFQGDDVIYGHPHVTVGDWLTEAISSGATALADRETIARRPGRPQHRVEHAHFTKLSALSTIGALEALAAQTGEPKLADRQWVIRGAAGEAVESWEEIRDEHNGLQYAVASWLTLALRAYLTALETGAEVEPMEMAKWLTRALAWTAGELAASEDVSRALLS